MYHSILCMKYITWYKKQWVRNSQLLSHRQDSQQYNNSRYLFHLSQNFVILLLFASLYQKQFKMYKFYHLIFFFYFMKSLPLHLNLLVSNSFSHKECFKMSFCVFLKKSLNYLYHSLRNLLSFTSLTNAFSLHSNLLG